MDLLCVLDGPSHPGLVLDLDASSTTWVEDGCVYEEVDGLHRHEQHGRVRWFQLVATDESAPSRLTPGRRAR